VVIRAPPELTDAYVRRILPGGYASGDELAVTLSLGVSPARAPANVTIIEEVPEGFTVLDGAGASQSGRTLQWSFSGDQVATRSWAYRLRVPEAAPDVAGFSGSAVYAGATVGTIGDSTIYTTPAAPESLRLEMLLAAYLSWPPSPSPHVSAYNLYRSADGGPRERLAFVNGTSYVDKSVERGPSYSYQVTAVNASGGEGPPGAPTPATPITMVVREIEDFNCGGGVYPGYQFCPSAVEAPTPFDLDPRYDYYYETGPWWLTGQLFYRPGDSIAIVDDDPSPDKQAWHMGWTLPNDWWRYSFDVPSDGWVKVLVRAATPGPGELRFFWDEEYVGSVTAKTDGWLAYDDVPLPDPFWSTAGKHTLRVQEASGGVNLDLLGLGFGCAPPTRRVVFREDFENYTCTAELPTLGGWQIVNGTGATGPGWEQRGTDSEIQPYSLSGMRNRFVIADCDMQRQGRVDTALISPTLDCRGLANVRLEFSHEIAFNNDSSTPQFFELRRWTCLTRRKAAGANSGRMSSIVSAARRTSTAVNPFPWPRWQTATASACVGASMKRNGTSGGRSTTSWSPARAIRRSRLRPCPGSPSTTVPHQPRTKS